MLFTFSCFLLSVLGLMKDLDSSKVYAIGSSSLPPEALILKHIVSGPTFNFVTLCHHTTSQIHTFLAFLPSVLLCS